MKNRKMVEMIELETSQSLPNLYSIPVRLAYVNQPNSRLLLTTFLSTE
jgi:hypothetical protein